MLNETLTRLEVIKKGTSRFLSGLKRTIEANSLKFMVKSQNVRKMTISKAVRIRFKNEILLQAKTLHIYGKIKSHQDLKEFPTLNTPKESSRR